MTIDIGTVSCDVFSPQVGQVFHFLTPDGVTPVIDLTLVTATEKPNSTPRWAKRTAMCLYFEHEGETAVSSGTYMIDHPTEGLFGPVNVERVISGQPGRPLFELIFN